MIQMQHTRQGTYIWTQILFFSLGQLLQHNNQTTRNNGRNLVLTQHSWISHSQKHKKLVTKTEFIRLSIQLWLQLTAIWGWQSLRAQPQKRSARSKWTWLSSQRHRGRSGHGTPRSRRTPPQAQRSLWWREYCSTSRRVPCRGAEKYLWEARKWRVREQQRLQRRRSWPGPPAASPRCGGPGRSSRWPSWAQPGTPFLEDARSCGCIREVLQFGTSLGIGVQEAGSLLPCLHGSWCSWLVYISLAKPEQQTETERWHLAFREVGPMERDMIVKATECLNQW